MADDDTTTNHFKAIYTQRERRDYLFAPSPCIYIQQQQQQRERGEKRIWSCCCVHNSHAILTLLCQRYCLYTTTTYTTTSIYTRMYASLKKKRDLYRSSFFFFSPEAKGLGRRWLPTTTTMTTQLLKFIFFLGPLFYRLATEEKRRMKGRKCDAKDQKWSAQVAQQQQGKCCCCCCRIRILARTKEGNFELLSRVWMRYTGNHLRLLASLCVPSQHTRSLVKNQTRPAYNRRPTVSISISYLELFIQRPLCDDPFVRPVDKEFSLLLGNPIFTMNYGHSHFPPFPLTNLGETRGNSTLTPNTSTKSFKDLSPNGRIDRETSRWEKWEKEENQTRARLLRCLLLLMSLQNVNNKETRKRSIVADELYMCVDDDDDSWWTTKKSSTQKKMKMKKKKKDQFDAAPFHSSFLFS